MTWIKRTMGCSIIHRQWISFESNFFKYEFSHTKCTIVDIHTQAWGSLGPSSSALSRNYARKHEHISQRLNQRLVIATIDLTE